MNDDGLAQGILDALPEPAFLVTPEGALIGENRAARGIVEGDRVPARLAELVSSPPESVERYLAHCRQTTTPTPGALSFRTKDGERRLRVSCARLRSRVGNVVLLLRCTDPRSDRFSVLDQRVRQLDSELRKRVREKAILREALDENRNLMRELQHRVKNNIQMMISLLSMSAVNSGSPEVRAFVKGAKERFRALATTQDLIYEAESASAVPARELFGRLATALADSTDGAVEILTDITDVWLQQDTAHCLALILNELLTNSLKHGISGSGRIRITLSRAEDGQLRLVVQDDGPGYPDLDALPRSSGLVLIRGLCRQIGAGLDLGNQGGARTVLTFADSAAVSDQPGEDPRSRLTATPAST